LNETEAISREARSFSSRVWTISTRCSGDCEISNCHRGLLSDMVYIIIDMMIGVYVDVGALLATEEEYKVTGTVESRGASLPVASS
jgi:hypothetical protein